jgi:hypothetical protein
VARTHTRTTADKTAKGILAIFRFSVLYAQGSFRNLTTDCQHRR